MKEPLHYMHLLEPNGFIYFIQMGDIGPVKIGFTTDVNKRLISLQTASPYPLRLLYHFPADESEESEWHTAYREIRLQGEWFLAHPKLLENIKSHKRQTLLMSEFDRNWRLFQGEWGKLGIKKHWKNCPLLYQVAQEEQNKIKLRHLKLDFTGEREETV